MRHLPVLLIVVSGLAAQTASRPASNTPKDIAGERAHKRLMQIQQQFHQANKLLNDELALENAKLDRDIAKLEGRTPNVRSIAEAQAKVDADNRAGYSATWMGFDLRALQQRSRRDKDCPGCERMEFDLSVMVMIVDCSEAIIEKHNASYPNDHWEGTADIRDQLGGKPDEKRLARARACAENGGTPVLKD